LTGTDRDVGRETFRSRRFLLADDGQGYSFHDTLIQAGTELHMWYKHHVESVYCVSGEGELEDTTSGEVYAVEDGTFYCLDAHDKHVLRATTDLRLICIFTPALVGPELHDEEGSFPLLVDAPVASPDATRVVEQAERIAERVSPKTQPAARRRRSRKDTGADPR